MRTLHRRSAVDRGFTQVELLVSIMLLSIVVGLATGALIKAIDQQSNLSQSMQAQTSNQNGIELFSRLLRQAVYPKNGTTQTSTIITTAQANKIVFTSRATSTAGASTSSLDTAIRQYTFELVGTDLKWGSAAQAGCPASGPCNYSTPTATNVAVRGIRTGSGSSVCPANTGDGQIFHYYYLNSTGTPTAYTNPVTVQTDLAAITYVKVELYTQVQTGPQKPGCVSLTDSIQLRNKL
jgi:prepilin-type N-terminal cleavage/methylation domain-containing protein